MSGKFNSVINARIGEEMDRNQLHLTFQLRISYAVHLVSEKGRSSQYIFEWKLLSYHSSDLLVKQREVGLQPV